MIRTALLTAAIVLAHGCALLAQQSSIPRFAPVTGGVSAAARSRSSGVAPTTAGKLGATPRGPVPRSLPGNLRLIAPEAPDDTVPAAGTQRPPSDGKRGFVELLPPPPDEAAPRPTIHEAKFFELPPAPEN